MIRIGVDLGGTKTEAIALASDGNIVARERMATPRDYAATVQAIAGLVHRVEGAAGAANAPVGVGIPGAVTPSTGFVKNANSVWLIGQP
ncbi:MAG: ROK family protein, partial [Gemmatimonadaceae bacterium]